MRPIYVFEKVSATAGTFALIYLVTEHYISASRLHFLMLLFESIPALTHPLLAQCRLYQSRATRWSSPSSTSRCR
jgi:hypothetical protein